MNCIPAVCIWGAAGLAIFRRNLDDLQLFFLYVDTRSHVTVEQFIL